MSAPLNWLAWLTVPAVEEPVLASGQDLPVLAEPVTGTRGGSGAEHGCCDLGRLVDAQLLEQRRRQGGPGVRELVIQVADLTLVVDLGVRHDPRLVFFAELSQVAGQRDDGGFVCQLGRSLCDQGVCGDDGGHPACV